MKKTYIAPKNWVVQLNLSDNVANLIVTSKEGIRSPRAQG